MTHLSEFEEALVRSLYPDYSGESWKDDNARDIAADLEPLIAERVRAAQEQAWNEGVAACEESRYRVRNGLTLNPYAKQGDNE